MSGAYIVLATEDNIIHTCELHAGRMAAFDMALELSKKLCLIHPEWIDSDPIECVWAKGNGGAFWTFVETSKVRVCVIFSHTPATQTQLAQRQKIDNFILDDTGVQVAVLPVKLDDPSDRSLPGGWAYDNKPITMASLDDDPYGVKMTSELTEAQKWALVIARVNKRQAISILIPGRGTYLKSAILPELNNKTPIGLQIRDAELAWLDQYLTAKRI